MEGLGPTHPVGGLPCMGMAPVSTPSPVWLTGLVHSLICLLQARRFALQVCLTLSLTAASLAAGGRSLATTKVEHVLVLL